MTKTTMTTTIDPTALDVDDDPRVQETRARVAALSARVEEAQTGSAAVQAEARAARKVLDDVEMAAALAELEGKPADRAAVRDADARYRAALEKERPAARLLTAAQHLHAEALAGVEAVEIEALHRIAAALHTAYRASADRLDALLEHAAAESRKLEALHRTAQDRFPYGGPRGALRSRAKIAVDAGLTYLAWPELREDESGQGVYVPSRLTGWRRLVAESLGEPTERRR
jgi:hypothetical protein